MADRVLVVSWGANVPGREERGLEVFNEAVGIMGRMQQEGRIEKFDIVLLEPNGGVSGYIEMHGSAEQLAAVTQDPEFRSNTADASLIVNNLKHTMGVTNEAIASEMELYRAAISRVPQPA
ncbi:MAG: hypothetical protein QOJ29_2763 [Thermoleophilaceae bacterium]|nr:hypothetical protein [Thermoleophilaceae bacterium]